MGTEEAFLQTKIAYENYFSQQEQKFFDINRVPGNGILIFPLSMSRLHKGQDPKALYDFLCFFDQKLVEKSVDVIFLYTNGLYFNNVGVSPEYRKKTTAQMLTHKQELNRLIKKHNRFSPKAIHFLPWDYIILQCDTYLELQAEFLKLMDADSVFKQLIDCEIKTTTETMLEARAFIIEESIVTYLIRNKKIVLPMTLSDANAWRLLLYSGRCLMPDVYLYQKKLLPQQVSSQDQWFHQTTSYSMYNMEKRILVDYNKIDFSALTQGKAVEYS